MKLWVSSFVGVFTFVWSLILVSKAMESLSKKVGPLFILFIAQWNLLKLHCMSSHWMNLDLIFSLKFRPFCYHKNVRFRQHLNGVESEGEYLPHAMLAGKLCIGMVKAKLSNYLLQTFHESFTNLLSGMNSYYQFWFYDLVESWLKQHCQQENRWLR